MCATALVGTACIYGERLRRLFWELAALQLLNTLWMSLPSFVNVGAILFLTYFIYAIGTVWYTFWVARS